MPREPDRIEDALAEIARWQEIASQGIQIERELRIEIERLKAALGPGATEAWEHMYDEIERLKAALVTISQSPAQNFDTDMLRAVARAALEPKP